MAAPRRRDPAGDGNDDRTYSPHAAGAINVARRPSKGPSFPKTTRRRFELFALLLPPLLMMAGLTIFTRSFFLSRTPFVRRSSCEPGAAGAMLEKALGLTVDDVDFLRRGEFLSDDGGGDSKRGDGREAVDDGGGGGGGAGCWVPRRVDSMVILVVDALRFDFARDHLPLSVGSRLFPSQNSTSSVGSDSRSSRGTSELYQFVADPPTVTMQRLKGLTTGGLPTFADITGSFGGASVEEDSWLAQLRDAPWDRRHRRTSGEKRMSYLAFVGDDTWVDLFPTQFDDCHPFPSFNTRDLDTVDNGCLEHLPRLLDGLVGLKKEKGPSNDINDSASSFELVVAHFLGVDHVGHTYGPNNPHMEGKLHQMDVMLNSTLDRIDSAPQESCIAALVLGDHGMTEDGNHGGGTNEEVNAGLFAHFSPGCDRRNKHERLDGDEEVPGSARAFDSIHQIDLVPTISFLLGLPVPYANIGGLVPDLLPPPRVNDDHPSPETQSLTSTSSMPHAAAALALNAAQVWDYLHTYSQTSRDLPKDKLRELKDTLDGAALVYRDAISHSRRMQAHGADVSEGERFLDSSAYRQACRLFKLFLAESTDLGKRVWTQFNERGMMVGIGILVLAWFAAIPLWKGSVRAEMVGTIYSSSKITHVHSDGIGTKENVKGNDNGSPSSLMMALRSFRRLELMTALLFMIFQCGALTFSNSYIEHEWEIVTFFLAILCLLVFRRWCFAPDARATTPTVISATYLPLIVVLCSRTDDIFLTGHGLDPSLRLHAAHHPIVFLPSLLVLILLRMKWLSPSTKNTGTGRMTSTSFFYFIDVVVALCLAGSWWEKRTLDQSRNGFVMARFAMAVTLVGLGHSLFTLAGQWKMSNVVSGQSCGGSWVEHAQLSLFRAMLFVVIVTGPSAASTAVLILVQCSALRLMMESRGGREVAAPVMAAMWRLAIRHAFFTTNHHCSFNRLQFSAAFVASNNFQFYIAGLSLFMNTFGWEIMGSALVLVYSRGGHDRSGLSSRSTVWNWFQYFQWTEMLTSCLSVSVMKRHLMVWAIFAPRFMFAAVFTVVGLIFCALDVFASKLVAPLFTKINKSKRQIS